MKVYAINYTLTNKKQQDYELLWAAIKGASNGNFMRCLDSFWIITSEAVIADVYNHLAKTLKQDDYLVVHEMTGNYVCFLRKNERDWLKGVLG